MYRVTLPTGKTVSAVSLDTLCELARAGVIHAETPIYDLETKRSFLAQEHPLLKEAVPRSHKPATSPAQAPNWLISLIIGLFIALLSFGAVWERNNYNPPQSPLIRTTLPTPKP